MSKFENVRMHCFEYWCDVSKKYMNPAQSPTEHGNDTPNKGPSENVSEKD